MLRQASYVYENREYYGPELARMNYLWSKIDSVAGHESESQRKKSVALRHYRNHSRILPQDAKLDEEITQEDFDGILGFQSR